MEAQRELAASMPKRDRPSTLARMRALRAVARGRFHRFSARVSSLGHGLRRRRRGGRMTSVDMVADDTLHGS